MALFSPEFLSSMVSIREIIGLDDDKLRTRSVATGFLAGYKTGQKDGKEDLYRVFLVTNKHVFEDKDRKPIKEMVLRFNTSDGSSHSTIASLLRDKNPKWLSHEDDSVDLAVLPLSAKALNENNIEYIFFADDLLVEACSFGENNVSIGDGVFVLGFPLSIDGELRNSPIVRHGIISRVDAELLSQNFFFIDSAAYPGNSGGPVIHKPEVVSVGKTKANSKCFVVGIVSSGITYSETAVDPNTNEPRITFRERTGLTKIVPIEKLNEIMKRNIEETLMKTSGDVEAKVEEIQESEVN